MFWNTKNCECGNVTPRVLNQSALLIQAIRDRSIRPRHRTSTADNSEESGRHRRMCWRRFPGCCQPTPRAALCAYAPMYRGPLSRETVLGSCHSEQHLANQEKIENPAVVRLPKKALDGSFHLRMDQVLIVEAILIIQHSSAEEPYRRIRLSQYRPRRHSD